MGLSGGRVRPGQTRKHPITERHPLLRRLLIRAWLGSCDPQRSRCAQEQAALDEENEMGSPRSKAPEPTDKAADAGSKSTAETARTVRPMSHEPSRGNGTPPGMPKTASESMQTSVSTADPGFSSGV